MTACGCREVNSLISKKSFFYFITLTHSLSARNALFIGVSSVRVSVRVNPLPSHSHTYPHTKIRLKSHLSCQGTIKIKRKSKLKSKRKIKKRIREKTPLHPCDPWAFFDFKLCIRILTDLLAAILPYYTYLIRISIYISPAIIRPVSLRPQNEGQKTHGSHRCTRSLWDGFFWPLFSMQIDFKRICKRYRLRLLKLRLSNILSLIKQVPQTCKIRLISSISVRKKTFAYILY